jgi:pyrroline-5-carboxylate reductase
VTARETLRGATVALIGAGNMGLAMLEGWVGQGLAGDGVVVVEPNASQRLRELCASRGFALTAEAGTHVAPRNAVVLAVKPQMLDAGAASAAGFVDADSVVVSILAGKRIADLRARLPACGGVVRAMPNTPAAIGRGMTGAFASQETTEPQLK